MVSKMAPKLLSTVLIFLFAVTVQAQDPLKVAPTHYKIDFQNEKVRVIHINYGAHEKSALHEHEAGVVVNITNGHLRLTNEDGKVQEIFAKAGEARWFPVLKHRVENLGDKAFEGVLIEVK